MRIFLLFEFFFHQEAEKILLSASETMVKSPLADISKCESNLENLLDKLYDIHSKQGYNYRL